VPDHPALVLLGFAAATLGAAGGIGGALLLVPALVLLGADPADAAPIGLLTVAAGSLAAAPAQLEEGLVHHRIGLTLETAASAGAVGGALVADSLSSAALARVVAGTALVAAIAALRRRGLRNPPHATFAAEVPGEWPGTLAGAYRLGDGIVPYRARRVRVGWLAMLGSGVVTGLAGVGGGFIKTPIMSDVMHVPVRVAAATSTFTVGITAATGLVVFASQGRLDLGAGAAVVAGGLVGGLLGARVQQRLSPVAARRGLAGLLLVIAVILGATGGG
jgi:uncharacterized membrane protein YfcA